MGIERVMLLLKRIAQLQAQAPAQQLTYGYVNGLPGYVTIEADGVPQTTAFEVRGNKIAGIYVMRNPDKLHHLENFTLQ
jgi:RNA polymerase sigma-70 factor (ECF subfamily)